MSASDTLPTIKQYLIDELSVDHADLEQVDLPLIEEDVIDSLGIFSLVEFIDGRFDIDIDPEEITIENFGTLRAIDALVRSKLAIA